MNNLHLSLTNVKNESRLFKESATVLKRGLFEKVFIVGLWEEGVETKEFLEGNREIERLRLKSRLLPKNLFFQVFKYLEFMVSIWMRYRNRNVTVVNVHALGLLPLGVVLKAAYGASLIYDAHELETEKNGLTGLRKKVSKFIESSLIKYCDRIIVVGEAIADAYVTSYPQIRRPFVVLNCPPYQQVGKKEYFRDRFGISGSSTIFLYQGVLGKGRGIEHILDAFKGMEGHDNVLVMMGYGPLAGMVQDAAKESGNIYYHEAVSPDLLLGYSASADVGLSLIENTCLSYYYCMPNKLFEYVMAGIPVIVSDLFEMRRLVTEHGIGIVAAENSPEGIRDAVSEAKRLEADRLRQNLQKFAAHYNWEEQEKVLVKVYESLREGENG